LAVLACDACTAAFCHSALLREAVAVADPTPDTKTKRPADYSAGRFVCYEPIS
jgi:hypothetical protein